jgi:hypothetical protein
MTKEGSKGEREKGRKRVSKMERKKRPNFVHL